MIKQINKHFKGKVIYEIGTAQLIMEKAVKKNEWIMVYYKIKGYYPLYMYQMANQRIKNYFGTLPLVAVLSKSYIPPCAFIDAFIQAGPSNNEPDYEVDVRWFATHRRIVAETTAMQSIYMIDPNRSPNDRARIKREADKLGTISDEETIVLANQIKLEVEGDHPNN